MFGGQELKYFKVSLTHKILSDVNLPYLYGYIFKNQNKFKLDFLLKIFRLNLSTPT